MSVSSHAESVYSSNTDYTEDSLDRIFNRAVLRHWDENKENESPNREHSRHERYEALRRIDGPNIGMIINGGG